MIHVEILNKITFKANFHGISVRDANNITEFTINYNIRNICLNITHFAQHLYEFFNYVFV